MPLIPPEYVSQLDDLGITDTAESEWRYLAAEPEAFTFSSISCGCEEPPVTLAMTPTWLGGRRVYIVQCHKCRTIYWRNAVPLGILID
jgi:hypothetical protein